MSLGGGWEFGGLGVWRYVMVNSIEHMDNNDYKNYNN